MAAPSRRRVSIDRPRRQAGIALTLALLAVSAARCSPSPTSASTSAPYSQTDLVPGAGATAASGNTLGVNYTGWLYDASQPQQQGAQFDASTPGTPFSFKLGSGQVIAGWEQGLVGMHVGGLRRLVIPPSLGYGDTRHGLIPPNATLVFDIALVSVQ
jgi:FKBP-type peptidyl-prolyl cis-trans isomerase FkpA